MNLMTLNLKWVWELTPEQVFQKNKFVAPTTSKIVRSWEAQETKPFLGPKLPLDGTSLAYQLALTSKGRTEETIALHAELPTIQDSGDMRSGVLLFDKDDNIVASLQMSGVDRRQPFKMVVNPEYRGQGLAERMLVLWWTSVKHTWRTEGRQHMTWVVVNVLLNAYRTVVQNAIDANLPVPQAVRAELAGRQLSNDVLARAKAVDKAIPSG